MVTPALAGEHLTKVSAPEVDVRVYQSAVAPAISVAQVTAQPH
jgi:hypothetical protein